MNIKRVPIRSPTPAKTPIVKTLLKRGDGFAFSIKKTAIIAVRILIETPINPRIMSIRCMKSVVKIYLGVTFRN